MWVYFYALLQKQQFFFKIASDSLVQTLWNIALPVPRTAELVLVIFRPLWHILSPHVPNFICMTAEKETTQFADSAR
jgi:hypothetical protein